MKELSVPLRLVALFLVGPLLLLPLVQPAAAQNLDLLFGSQNQAAFSIPQPPNNIAGIYGPPVGGCTDTVTRTRTTTSVAVVQTTRPARDGPVDVVTTSLRTTLTSRITVSTTRETTRVRTITNVVTRTGGPGVVSTALVTIPGEVVVRTSQVTVTSAREVLSTRVSTVRTDITRTQTSTSVRLTTVLRTSTVLSTREVLRTTVVPFQPPPVIITNSVGRTVQRTLVVTSAGNTIRSTLLRPTTIERSTTYREPAGVTTAIRFTTVNLPVTTTRTQVRQVTVTQDRLVTRTQDRTVTRTVSDVRPTTSVATNVQPVTVTTTRFTTRVVGATAQTTRTVRTTVGGPGATRTTTVFREFTATVGGGVSTVYVDSVTTRVVQSTNTVTRGIASTITSTVTVTATCKGGGYHYEEPAIAFNF